MIEFKRLESGAPPDVEVTLDDVDAQLARVQDAFEAATDAGFLSAGAFDAATMGDDGRVVFVIPGDEVVDVADAFEDAGMLELQDQLQKWNQETIARAEAEE